MEKRLLDMDFTPNERLRFERSKEQISELSQELLEMFRDIDDFDSVKYNKRIISIQSKLSTLASFGKGSLDLSVLSAHVNHLMSSASLLETQIMEKQTFVSESLMDLREYTQRYVSMVNGSHFDWRTSQFKIDLNSL